MKTLLIIVILLVPTLLYAQADITEPPKEKKVIDKEFMAVGSYLVLMSVFDTETTFAVIHNGGHENNAIMKPIVNSGRPATYGVMLGTDALFMFIVYEMKKSSNPTFNKTWWVVPMVAGTTHGVCGGLNLRYAW
jgi:hypothetical protein